MMSKKVQKELLRIARASIESKLEHKDYVPDYTDLSDDCFDKLGVYVTLIEDNFLKSTAGFIDASKEVYIGVQEAALNAAFYTTKYKRTSKSDMDKIVIEISILTEPKKLDYKDSQDLLGKLNTRMGLILKEGMHKQVFLPTMWRMYPDKETFLDRLCSEAGMQERSWMRVPLNIHFFYTESFAEDDEN